MMPPLDLQACPYLGFESTKSSRVDFGSDDEEMEQDVVVDNDDDGIPSVPTVAATIVPPVQLGNNSVFHTFRPEGGMRDVITIECQKINGEEFKGTITYTEATVKIFQQGLGLTNEILHAVKMLFNKFRIVSFKLKNQINIDELADKDNFEIARSYMEGNQIKTDKIDELQLEEVTSN